MTIRELARACRVSTATVSLALNGHPRIPAATRERIARRAADLGYRTNPMVAALLSHVRQQKPSAFREVIGVLTTEPLAPARRQPFHREVARGLRERAALLGYGVDSFRLDDSLRAERLSRVLRSRGIRGLVVDGSCMGGNWPQLDWNELAGVVLAESETEHGLRRVAPDRYHNMEQLLAELDRRGYRRIGYYNHDEFEARVRGHWVAAYLRHQMPLPPERRVAPEMAVDWAPERLVTWVRQARPDAVICTHDMAVAWLRSAGVRVPEDVGVALPNWRAQRANDLAGIDQCPGDIGAAALDVVTSQLTRNEPGRQERPRITLISGIFRDGRTLRPRL
jgi:LacI family transcriptional regulator